MASPVSFTLTLNGEEHKELLTVLEQALVSTHAEARRTDNRGFRDQVHQEESLLRTLTEKVRALRA